MIAAEVGGNVEIAKRAALLHDIGKGMESDGEGNHVEVGMELARKIGEDPRVINAIGAHHDDVEPAASRRSIVQIADAISASRPGARKETLDNYLKRLESLEKIAEELRGRGQGLRHPGRARAAHPRQQRRGQRRGGAKELAKDIAKQIEGELKYPGRIKVTIIRETADRGVRPVGPCRNAAHAR